MLGRDEPYPERLYTAIPDAIGEDDPPPDVDAHDIRCFGMWAIVIMRDATIQHGVHFNKIRDFGPETLRTLERHHRHYLAEHAADDRRAQAQSLYPEPPV